MKMKITNAWLRRRIENDPDVDTDAGLPITKPEVLQAFAGEQETEVALKSVRQGEMPRGLVLGTLVRRLRRRDGMDIQHLATAARIPPEELRALEQDQAFVPRPRTIHQLAQHYKLPPRTLLKLSAAAEERDPVLDEVAVRFAACSDDLSKLSREERKRLDEFVKYISGYKEHTTAHEQE